jgi:hypothetical protein
MTDANREGELKMLSWDELEEIILQHEDVGVPCIFRFDDKDEMIQYIIREGY